MLEEKDERSRRSGVQSIEIGGTLLEALIALGRSAPLSEIAKAAELQPAKAHRYLTSLCEIGLTLQHGGTGHYALGPLALRIGLSAIAQHDILDRAFEVLVSLCEVIETSGHLSIWSDAGPVVIRSTHGATPVISPVSTGTVLPLNSSATGRIYLAFMPSNTTAEVSSTQHHPADLDESHLETIRAKGCSFADGQYIPGLSAMAFPIIEHDKRLAGAITLVSTNTKMFDPQGEVASKALEAMTRLRRDWSI